MSSSESWFEALAHELSRERLVAQVPETFRLGVFQNEFPGVRDPDVAVSRLDLDASLSDVEFPV